MELRDYLSVVWKRKLIIFICTVLALIAGVFINYVILKPVYKATAQILVEQPPRVIMLTEKAQRMPSALGVETQKRLLKSMPVAERAAKLMGLGNTPDKIRQAGSRLTKHITADSDEETGILSISIKGENAKECAATVNTYSEAFEAISRETLEKSNQETIRYLEHQMNNANAQLAVEEKTVFDLNQKYGVIDLNNEMTELNKTIISYESMKMETELQVKELEIQLDNLRELFRDKTMLVAQDPDALLNQIDSTISTKLVELEVERGTALTKYKPNHPVVQNLEKQIEEYRKKVERHVSDIINNRQFDAMEYKKERSDLLALDIQLLLAKTKIAHLDNIINKNRLDQEKYPKIQYEYNRMIREKDVAEKLFLLLYEQFQQAKIEETKRDVNIRVIEEASVPREPESPKRKKNIGIITLLGLMIGVALAFLLEEMEETIRTSDDVKNILNLPVLGSIPYSAETINKLITDVPLKSPIAEAYRRLSFFTQLFCLDPPIKSLLITSTKSDEGKSTTLANLAISMAQEGTKVLIVDTDLRRPMLHRMFGIDNSLGISSILSGELEAELAVSDLSDSGNLPKESLMDIVVDRLIQSASIKGLSIIPSGPLPANSIELLRSEKMLAFLRCVEKKADLIIFDSPPAIHVVDSVVLSQILDGVLFVINAGRINRDEALQVKYMVESTKTPIIGVALNNIEASSPDYYYYYYYGGYGYGSRQRRKRVKLKR